MNALKTIFELEAATDFNKKQLEPPFIVIVAITATTPTILKVNAVSLFTIAVSILTSILLLAILLVFIFIVALVAIFVAIAVIIFDFN